MAEADELEARCTALQRQLLDRRAAVAHGAEATEQLARELQQRRDARDKVRSEQERRTRQGVELRAQMLEVQEQVRLLLPVAAAREQETSELQRTLRMTEARVGRDIAATRRERKEAFQSFPSRLEAELAAERAEVRRCQNLVADWARELAVRKRVRGLLLERREQQAIDDERARERLWRAQGLRDASRASRLALEAEVAEAEAAIQQLSRQLRKLQQADVDLQTLQSFRANPPGHSFQPVLEHLDEYPASETEAFFERHRCWQKEFSKYPDLAETEPLATLGSLPPTKYPDLTGVEALANAARMGGPFSRYPDLAQAAYGN